MVAEWPSMLQHAIKRRFKFAVADQSWMQQYYATPHTAQSTPQKGISKGNHCPDHYANASRDLHLGRDSCIPRVLRFHRYFGRRWRVLDDELYNARPFAHPIQPRLVAAASRQPEPRIWHWHGYKSSDVTCWLHAMANGTWPERAWRQPTACDGRRGACSYKPIRGSGCRYLGRITPSPCYLRTYTYLLMQHERLLAHAQGRDTAVNTTHGVGLGDGPKVTDGAKRIITLKYGR